MRALIVALILCVACGDSDDQVDDTGGTTDVEARIGWPCFCDEDHDGEVDSKDLCGEGAVCRPVCNSATEQCLAGIPLEPICHVPCEVGTKDCDCVPIGNSAYGYCFAPPACGG